jgi:hypothetical protein
VQITGVQNNDAFVGTNINPARLQMRCPTCLHVAVLDARGADKTVRRGGNNVLMLASGERVCPNPECQALIWVIYCLGDPVEILFSYPPERFDFDVSDLPASVKEPLEEAIDCHANGSFKASALMIRRTLEAVCQDQGVRGDGSLFDRIEVLGKEVVLPTAMITGLHNLRLLGNDAAHVDARDYLEVGEAEVEAALDVTKLILSATYQSAKTLQALDALRADTSS